MTIAFGGLTDLRNVEVRITNLTGEVVFSEHLQNKDQLEINTKGLLKRSVYIVSVTSGETILKQKIIAR